MDRQTVQNIIAFLMRVDMKGNEAYAMVAAIEKLQGCIVPPPQSEQETDTFVSKEN